MVGSSLFSQGYPIGPLCILPGGYNCNTAASARGRPSLPSGRHVCEALKICIVETVLALCLTY